jgi:glycosyltransferase involved in cell wall biosynthesis
MNPFFSVIMPVHNGERFIAATLESVREQHHDGIELLIVDDGSTDHTLDIVRDFTDVLPIRLFTPGRVGGAEAASNIGLREAKGQWAGFLHCDDLWLPGRMARLWGEMQTTDAVLIVHNSVFVDPDGRRLGPWTCPLSEGDVPHEQFIERLLVQNFIAPVSPVFRRKAALDSGGMDLAIWACPDWDFWLRMGTLGPVRFIDETLTAYRVHPESQTVAHVRRADEWEQQLTIVLDRHLGSLAAAGKHRASIERVARASVAVNSALLAALRGEPTRPLAAIFKLLALGPAGWRRYLRDSRIIQRVGSRLKVRRRIKPSIQG